MSDQRIRYLDGLRGILAIIVFIHHYLYTFYPTVIFGGDYQTFFSGKWTGERIFALTPLNILFNPGTAINFFFLLSGYVQTLPYFRKPDLFFVQRSFIKRYFRLALPTLAVVVLVFIFHRLHLINKSHIPPNSLTLPWIKSMMPDTLNFFQTLQYGLVHCFNNASPVRNYQVLWTMSFELYNSWMVLILLLVTYKIKNRLPLFVFWFLVQLLVLKSYFGMAFTLGLLVAYIQTNVPRFTTLFSGKLLKSICLIVGLYFASYPFTGYETSSAQSMYLPISFFDKIPATISYAFGNLLLFCVILHSSRIQQFLSKPILLFFGNISFMFYLVHFLLLFSFSPWVFFHLFPSLHNTLSNYFLTGVSTFALITLVSFVLYKLVDLPVVKLCNIYSKRLFQPLAAN